jgi:hypothetical protein
MTVESKAPDKHVNDVSVIGAGYILIVTICNSHICLSVYNFILFLKFKYKYALVSNICRCNPCYYSTSIPTCEPTTWWT